jgi:hypothetical protein
MNVGDRYALAWRFPHLLDATVIELQKDGVLCDVVHRCPIECYLQQMRQTLPIDGRRLLRYPELADWLPLNADAIALPA